MVTPADAAKLLTAARAVDNRVGALDEAKCVLWSEVLADVPFPEAMAAVKLHYRESVDTIMPAHIRALVKRTRVLQESERRSVEARKPKVDDRPVLGQEGLAAIAYLRSLGLPNRPGALKISGSVGSGRAGGIPAPRQALRGPAGPSSFRSLIGPAVDAMAE